jgi:hypothetical protein
MSGETPEAIEETGTFGNYLIHGINEIILPESISWWPSAPGWQVLGFFIFSYCLFLIGRLLKRWLHNRYRREALRQIASVQAQTDNQAEDVVAVLPFFLKAVALKAYPREDVASLSGNEWLTFLDSHYPGPPFSIGIGEKLVSIAYLPRDQWQLNDQECTRLIDMSQNWIQKHGQSIHV